MRKFLLGTRLFIDKQSKEQIPKAQGYLVALAWVAIGLLLTLQTDWILGYFIPKTQTPTSITSSATTSSNNTRKTTPKVIPTFNARQLDEQLTLYRQRLQKTGHPPDILIVGSSRALRGIDPVALSKGLASRGLGNMDVFNFGINGATAQVVDFILRKVLEPQELPKIIVWGDGSRAFNNARPDLTFRTIAASPGYKLINNSKHENSYQDLDQWLNQSLSTVSTTYQNRDRVKTLLGEGLAKVPLGTTTAKPNKDSDQETSAQKVDSNGFLALSIRFDPSTYYHKHPKVSGSYDKDYTPFALNGSQDLAFQAILRFTQVKKILGRTCVNLMVVMVVCGIWHGATLGFLVWGMLHGLALIVHRLVAKISDGTKLKQFWQNPIGIILAWFLTQLMVFTSWIWFRLPNLSDSTLAVQHMWGHSADTQFAQLVYVDALKISQYHLTILLFALATCFFVGYFFKQELKLQLNWYLKLLFVPLCFYAVWLLAPEGSLPFIYFDY